MFLDYELFSSTLLRTFQITLCHTREDRTLCTDRCEKHEYRISTYRLFPATFLSLCFTF